LTLIDPAGELDPIFFEITRHRAAAAHHDRCVDVHQEAEGKVSADEFSHLQRNTRIAWDEMMLFARCVISLPADHPPRLDPSGALPFSFAVSTIWRAARAVACISPTRLASGPWAMAFLQSLAAGLRKMAGELDPQNEGARL